MTGDDNVPISFHHTQARETPPVNPTNPPKNDDVTQPRASPHFTSPNPHTPSALQHIPAMMDKLQAQIEKTSEEYQKLQKGVFFPV